ncbi:hypothetical protein OUZ56_024069 [Daphnia magna]|uniref:Uncharacterized protein n=1 Tax=Daphnia magna TaxID=35525 RepID=A0ABR0B038_9CRUS|nr:hypothetical protein OUZ56_024069 [Daphnia magna]
MSQPATASWMPSAEEGWQTKRRGSGVDTKPLNFREVSTVASKRKRRTVLGKDFNLPPALNNMAGLDQSVKDSELTGMV